MHYRNRSKGFMLLGLLMALVIVLILMGYYFKKDKDTQRMYVQTQIDKSKNVACTVNRQTLSTSIMTWTISHPGEQVTVEKLRQAAASVPHCPDNIDYIFDNNGNVYCPIHFPPPGQTPMQKPSRLNIGSPEVDSPSAPAAGTLDRVKQQLGQ